MTSRRPSGLRRALFAGIGLLVVVACAHEDYTFVPEGQHCFNETIDAELGESDVDCGGRDCRSCGPGLRCNTTLDCQRGECLGGLCEEAGCENRFRDPGETGIDCGGVCQPCPAGQPCEEGSDCVTGVCDSDTLLCARSRCDDRVWNGEESDIDCGGPTCDGCLTGESCFGNRDCQSGACEPETFRCIVECMPGRGDCIVDDGEECETNTLTTVEHCGDCDKPCELANASAACAGGVCKIDECEANWDDCRGGVEDGCETNLETDAEHCGECERACSADNGTPFCGDGKCGIMCDTGYENCDGQPGCEARVNSDTANCGECERVCPQEDGETAYCADGDCGVSDCPDDYGNCDGPLNGSECEDNLLTDPENCGRCGRLCVVAHGTAACVDGECVVDECDEDEGWYDCIDEDEEGGKGCETNTFTSQDNCGACGNSCDTENAEGRCTEGTCRIDSCEDGFDNCNRDDEDGGFADGCETDLQSLANCGVCGNDCSDRFPNATVACVDSVCVQGDCNPGFEDCVAGTGGPGCESELATSEAHCGECGNSCELSGAVANSCESGSCQVTCDSTHLTCDESHANGCETLQGVTRCGGCETVCASGAAVHATSTACVASGDTSVCQPACTAGWGACDNPQDGCLTQLNASPHCGSCGAVCSDGDSCLASNGVYRCQSPLTIVNNVATGGGTAPSLTLTHNLQAGRNRVVVVGVAGRSSGANGGTIAQARPDSVRYAGVDMNVMGEFAGPPISQDGQGHLFYYFLTDSGSPRLPSSGGQVVIDASMAPSPVALAAVVAQFNGANQTNPLITGATSSIKGPTSTSTAVTVGTAGSVIFSLAVAQYAGDRSTATGALVNPAPPSPPGQPLMNMKVEGTSGNLWWLGAAASAPLATGMYNVGWFWQYCDSAVHYAVILQPYRSP